MRQVWGSRLIGVLLPAGWSNQPATMNTLHGAARLLTHAILGLLAVSVMVSVLAAADASLSASPSASPTVTSTPTASASPSPSAAAASVVVDDDKDGVEDSVDLCLDTRRLARVDRHGCSRLQVCHVCQLCDGQHCSAGSVANGCLHALPRASSWAARPSEFAVGTTAPSLSRPFPNLLTSK